MKNQLRKPLTQAFQFLLFNQRSSRNITQYELALRSGFSRQYISLVENGKKMPTVNFIFCMAESFGMNTKEFMDMLVDKFSYYESKANKT